MSASSSSPSPPFLHRKTSLGSIIRGAEPKLGNQPPNDVHAQALIRNINKILYAAKALHDKAQPLPPFLHCFLFIWNKAVEFGEDAKPFPAVISAMVLLQRITHQLKINFASLSPTDQYAWTIASFLLASKVEETPLGFSPRKMWHKFTWGKNATEQSDFNRLVLQNEARILVGLGFNIVVKLPHIRLLRIVNELGITTQEIIEEAIYFCTTHILDSTLALCDPTSVAAASLQLAGFSFDTHSLSQFKINLTELDTIRARLAQQLGSLGIAFSGAVGDGDPNGSVTLAHIVPSPHVNNFEKLVELNKGTYGTVWRAKDTRNDELVALKLLHSPISRSDGFRYYVLREMLYLIRLNHPNIIKGREVVYDDTMFKLNPHKNDIDFYICMDLVQFDLLKLMLKQCDLKTRFNQAQVKHLMKQLLSGVQHMHSYSLLHRDLKLANVLLTSNGELKIADLGSIRDTDRTHLTLTLQVVSLFYRPPELLMMTNKYTSALDIWSCGCLFYELLTYRRLFAGSSETEMFKKILRVKGSPPDEVWESIYAHLPGVTAPILETKRECRTPIPLSTQHDFQITPGITPNAIDLLSRMLDWDPRTRISAVDALNHPYFTEDPQPEIPIPNLAPDALLTASTDGSEEST